MTWLKQNWHRVIAHLLGIAPAVFILYRIATQQLTANPIQYLTHQTGDNALRLLVLSLVCTPLNLLFGWRWATQLRRPLGLWGFAFVVAHLSIYALVDYQLDFGLMWQELSEKRYVVVGFTAFLLLIPLAITSTKGWQKRLGKRWKQLHWLVYLIVPLGVAHFVWLVKAGNIEPWIYAAIVTFLLVLRLPPIRQAIVRTRQRLFPPRAVPRRTVVEK